MLTTKNKTMKDLRKFIAELEEEARFKLAIAKTCYVVLNNYQIKEVNDTEKGLIFKQILTQKT